MSLTIGASPSTSIGAVVGGTFEPTGPSNAVTMVPHGAVQGAVAGSQGGAASTMGGGGTALAGAAGAGSGSIGELLKQLTAALAQLAVVLQPNDGGAATDTVAGGGGAATPTPGACGCAGGGSKERRDRQDRGARPKATGADRSKDAKQVSGGGAAAAPDAPAASASKWVTGDTDGLDADLLGRLATLGERMGQKVDISSGNRTRAEQAELYAKYKAGTGNLAARPGTSNHEHGDAADATIGGVDLASNAKAKQLAAELGLHFPVPGEPWHVEVKR